MNRGYMDLFSLLIWNVLFCLTPRQRSHCQTSTSDFCYNTCIKELKKKSSSLSPVMMVCSLHHYATGTLMAHNAACHASIHRENSPVTQTTPEPTLFSWGGWPREKSLSPPPRYSNHPRAHTVVLGRLTTRTHPPNTAPTPPHTPTPPTHQTPPSPPTLGHTASPVLSR